MLSNPPQALLTRIPARADPAFIGSKGAGRWRLVLLPIRGEQGREVFCPGTPGARRSQSSRRSRPPIDLNHYLLLAGW